MERAATVIIQSSCIFVTYRRRVVSYWADSHARQRILFCFLACFSYVAVPTHTHTRQRRGFKEIAQLQYITTVIHLVIYIHIQQDYISIYIHQQFNSDISLHKTHPPSLSTPHYKTNPTWENLFFYPCHCTFTLIYRARNTGFSHRTFLTVVYPSCSAAASGIMPSHNNGIKGIVGQQKIGSGIRRINELWMGSGVTVNLHGVLTDIKEEKQFLESRERIARSNGIMESGEQMTSQQ